MSLLCFRLLEGAILRIPLYQEFLHVGGLFVLYDAAGRASLQDPVDTRVVAVGVAAPEGFLGDGRLHLVQMVPLLREVGAV